MSVGMLIVVTRTAALHLSLSLSVHFNGGFPDEPGLAGVYRSKV